MDTIKPWFVHLSLYASSDFINFTLIYQALQDKNNSWELASETAHYKDYQNLNETKKLSRINNSLKTWDSVQIKCKSNERFYEAAFEMPYLADLFRFIHKWSTKVT